MLTSSNANVILTMIGDICILQIERLRARRDKIAGDTFSDFPPQSSGLQDCIFTCAQGHAHLCPEFETQTVFNLDRLAIARDRQPIPKQSPCVPDHTAQCQQGRHTSSHVSACLTVILILILIPHLPVLISSQYYYPTLFSHLLMWLLHYVVVQCRPLGLYTAVAVWHDSLVSQQRL
jgi:hypothetical protein